MCGCVIFSQDDTSMVGLKTKRDLSQSGFQGESSQLHDMQLRGQIR